MKTTELMINDLVMFNGEVYRIKNIHGNAELVDLSPYYVKSKKGEYLMPICKHASLIYHIDLTDEILKENGFEMYLGDWCLVGSLFKMHIFVEGGYCASAFSEQVFINYVHELQHALRICGLSDLADNLKLV